MHLTSVRTWINLTSTQKQGLHFISYLVLGKLFNASLHIHEKEVKALASRIAALPWWSRG